MKKKVSFVAFMIMLLAMCMQPCLVFTVCAENNEDFVFLDEEENLIQDDDLLPYVEQEELMSQDLYEDEQSEDVPADTDADEDANLFVLEEEWETDCDDTVQDKTELVLSVSDIEEPSSEFLLEGIAETAETEFLLTEESEILLASDDDAGAVSCATVEEAAAALRSAMKERVAEISISLTADQSKEDENEKYHLNVDLYQEALKDTGAPDEGEYLQWHLDCVTSGYTVYEDYTLFTFYLEYYDTLQQENMLRDEIAQVLSGLDLGNDTDYVKIHKIYDYICRSVSYDYDHLNDDSYKLKYTAYAALINKTAVCQGYSQLLYRMLREAGIYAQIISGSTDGQEHMWVIAKLHDLYYNLDCTWDTNYIFNGYMYFLRGSESFSDHVRDETHSSDDFCRRYPVPDSDYSIREEDKAAQYEYTDDAAWKSYQYRTADGYAYITKYNGTEKTVTLPSVINGFPVIGIDRGAFSGNQTLQSVTISEGIQVMSSEAFFGCSSLESISLPSTFRKDINSAIGFVFSSCQNIKNIKLPSGNPFMKLVNGCLLSKDGKEFLMYPAGSERKSYQIPDGVKTIYTDSFSYCSHLNEVILPDGLETINEFAFEGSSISRIDIPSSCSFIGQWAFSNCPIKTLSIPASLDTAIVPFGLFELEEYSTSSSSGLFNARDGVLFIKQCLLAYPAKKRDYLYEVPSGTSVIASSAFLEAAYLRAVIIPDSVTKIESDAFERCNVTIYCNPGSAAQKYADNNGITWKKMSETTIGGESRGFTWSLDNQGILRISGEGPIKQGLEYKWMKYSDLIRSVIFEEGITEVNGFDYVNVESVKFPDSVEVIGDYVFRGEQWLTSVTLPKGLKKIAPTAFYGQRNITGFKLSANNKSFTVSGGILFNKDKTSLIKYPPAKQGSYTVPDTVKTIEDDAFACSRLEEIILPGGLTRLGNNAFEQADLLKSIHIPKGIDVLNNSVFNQCKSLETVSFSKGKLGSIENSAFQGCQKLKSVTIPDTVRSIGPAAFSSCSSLKTVKLPSGLEEIYYDAFTGCPFTKIELPPSINWISEDAFGIYFEDGYERFRDELLIVGKRGSTAQDYASQKGLRFEASCKWGHIGSGWTWTGTLGEQKGTCKVCRNTITRTVTPKITLSKSSVKIQKNKTTVVKVSGLRKDDLIKSVKSSDTKIASVSLDRKTITIKAKKTAGKATVTIRLASGLKKKIPVTVPKKTTTKITGLKETMTVRKGKTLTLSPAIKPALSDDPVTYSSKDRTIASVSKKGVIKGNKKGSTTVTVQSGKVKFIITVIVK